MGESSKGTLEDLKPLMGEYATKRGGSSYDRFLSESARAIDGFRKFGQNPSLMQKINPFFSKKVESVNNSLDEVQALLGKGEGNEAEVAYKLQSVLKECGSQGREIIGVLGKENEEMKEQWVQSPEDIAKDSVYRDHLIDKINAFEGCVEKMSLSDKYLTGKYLKVQTYLKEAGKVIEDGGDLVMAAAYVGMAEKESGGKVMEIEDIETSEPDLVETLNLDDNAEMSAALDEHIESEGLSAEEVLMPMSESQQSISDYAEQIGADTSTMYKREDGKIVMSVGAVKQVPVEKTPEELFLLEFEGAMMSEGADQGRVVNTYLRAATAEQVALNNGHDNQDQTVAPLTQVYIIVEASNKYTDLPHMDMPEGGLTSQNMTDVSDDFCNSIKRHAVEIEPEIDLKRDEFSR